MRPNIGVTANVKTFLLSIVILFVLVAVFSTTDMSADYTKPFGNWAFFGNSGEPLPGKGEPSSEVKTFTFGEPQPTAETTDFCPITFEVVTKEKDEPEPSADRRNLSMINHVLYGVAGTLFVEMVALMIVVIVMWCKTHPKKEV